MVAGSVDFVTARVGEIPGRAAAGRFDAFAADGLTPVVIAVDGARSRRQDFGDPLRADAVPALARMRARGWRLGLLSGDHPDVVAAVGRRLGIDPRDYRGGVSPEAKAAVRWQGAPPEDPW